MSTRHRFMGDMPGQPLDALLVAACNRLAKRTEGGAALAFEALGTAAAGARVFTATSSQGLLYGFEMLYTIAG